MTRDNLPVAVIGAGPIGLAAAVHVVLERGLPVKVYEAGVTVGASVRDWGHVRLFSPWRYNIDAAPRALLERQGWQEPPADAFPTGRDLYAQYLKPLAGDAGDARRHRDRHRREGDYPPGAPTRWSPRTADKKPFELIVLNGDRGLRREGARAVIDASGTWKNRNPLGAAGITADGEEEHSDKVAYGLPDVLGRDRVKYKGRTTLVIGAGHSAANVLIDVVELARRNPRQPPFSG